MSKPKVLVCSRLPGDTQKQLEKDFAVEVNEGEAYSHEELIARARDKDAVIGVIVNRFDKAFFEACPGVKLLANVAVGYDNIDLDEARRRGVLVTNTPGVLTDSTADLAFALLLATARRLPEAQKYLKEGKWKRFALDLLTGVDVHHKTIGIIGMGRIGHAMATRARGFSMHVLYSQRNRVSEDIEESLHAHFVSLDELLQRSDFVSIHCPLNSETKHLIGRAELAKMKNTAVLINTSRGAVVDEPALANALRNKIIASAGLDVFENEPQITPELLDLENVVLLPHIGSASIETRTAMGQLAVDAVVNAFNKRLPPNAVNKDNWDSSKFSLLAL